MPESITILGKISAVQAIAAGRSVHALPRLERLYGRGRWRKMKGVAIVRLRNGSIRVSELHWYEAHGIGRFEFKRKRDVRGT